MININLIVDKLLNMQPDIIPKFILLKEFKKVDLNCSEYQELYTKVCQHETVLKAVESQNERGFWVPFHGYSEGMIRRLLAIGLDKEHVCLKNTSEYLVKMLRGKESFDQYEKQDHPNWYPKMFVPLICASMLSLIEPEHEILNEHRKIWAHFAQIAFADGSYNREADIKEQSMHFGFSTQRAITPFNYFVLLLLAPVNDKTFLTSEIDKALVDFCINEADALGYVYNNSIGKCIPIDTQRRDSRDFCHWIRALSIISQYKVYEQYKDKYNQWVLGQQNKNGFWELPKRYNLHNMPLSDSWRKQKNRTIDSTIIMLRFLNNAKGY